MRAMRCVQCSCFVARLVVDMVAIESLLPDTINQSAAQSDRASEYFMTKYVQRIDAASLFENEKEREASRRFGVVFSLPLHCQ